MKIRSQIEIKQKKNYLDLACEREVRDGSIMQTCPCNILLYFMAVKMVISDEKM